MDKYSQQLLVEGKDDSLVILSLCKKFKIKIPFDIKDCVGVPNLKEQLKLLLKGSGNLNTIGVVLDADENLSDRWKSIYNILKKSGKYKDIPKTCDKDGTIIFPIEDDDIKVGVWLMPNNNDKGMLEDFVSFLIPEDDKLLPKVDKALSEIEEEKLNQYKEIHKSKARILTWLAWQKVPGTPMGRAITKKYLSIDPPICNDFISWLKNLFNIETT